MDVFFPGGAFYTPETIDTARLHYRTSWAPVLHAVALWLNSTGFGAGEDPEDPSKSPEGSSKTSSFEESVKDRMHLLLGKVYSVTCVKRLPRVEVLLFISPTSWQEV